jgi:hemoglobin/transferrin/lactoferrin receptor protein
MNDWQKQKNFFSVGWYQLGLVPALLLSYPAVTVAVEVNDNTGQSAESSAFEVAPVVVSATRVEQDIDDVSRAIVVIDEDEISTMQPQSVAEILRYQPNITISGGPRPGNQSVNIRGLTGQKVLQTIDGVRQTFESGHRPTYFLDPELIRDVEVLKGPTSSLWGSGALGGVVSQNTISARNLLKPGANLGGLVKSGYNSNNHQQTTTTALAGRVGNVDLLASGYYRDANDIELGNGDALAGSATRDQGGLLKAEWQIDDQQSLAINYRRAEVEGGVPSNGAANLGSSNFLIDRDQRTTTWSMEYHLDTNSPLVNSRLLAYRNKVEMDESRVSDGRYDSTELVVRGINLNNLSMIGDIALLYGIDGYREEFDARRGGIDRPAPPDAETDVWGAFVQATVPLSEAWKLELGVRYDRFETEAKNLNADSSDSDVSPSIAVIWQSSDWLKLTLRHDRAFRAPGAEALYSTGTHFCMFPGFCNTFLPNPDLKPEQAANTELLANMQFENLFADDSLRINAAVFRNKVDDFIEQIVTDPTFFPVMDPGYTTWVNVDEAEIKGYELSADYRLDQWQLKLAYGQTRGEDDKTGDDLTNIPADTFSADLNYRFGNRPWLAGVRFTHAARQDRTDYPENTAGQEYSDYNITDLYASWQPESLSGVKLDLTVNNVTDKHYRRAWEELYESGREIILAATYRF